MNQLYMHGPFAIWAHVLTVEIAKVRTSGALWSNKTRRTQGNMLWVNNYSRTAGFDVHNHTPTCTMTRPQL